MKKLFTILAAALFVVACGGGNSKKEEPKSIEDQLLEYVAKMERAVKADNYEKAIDIYWDYEAWIESLDDEQYEEFGEAFYKNEKRLYILDEVGSTAYYEENEGMYCEDDECEPEVPVVYSNCFDGYLNVRAGASTKSQVLGILRNGEAAELLSVEGKWTKVRVNGIEGYIWSADTQSTPSDPVYIDSSAVVGEWVWTSLSGGAHGAFFSIQSNGEFTYEISSGINEAGCGSWYLSYDKIVLKFSDGSEIVGIPNGDAMDIDGRTYDRN